MTVLLGVAHGSRDEAAQDVVRGLLAGAAALRPGLRTADAYVDNASPSVRNALQALVADGADDVVVLPLLLTSATHSKTDVAAAVRTGHPGLRLRYGRPLWPSAALVEVLARRLREADARPEDPVVLVAGGSADPDANAQVAAAARLLWEGREWPSVDVAFASTTRPTVPEALERLRLLGSGRVAVSRFFLAPGYLPRLVERQATSVPGLEVVLAEPLGVSDELSALVLERYDEARGADLRMNCDVCMYRTALPGRENRVGAAQVPHAHPDD
ncbi:MAG: sirohydrochlorin chelatase [Frankiales bacterium]|jgi:sirohydrochlorin cobaltochelatase|nr:sirohydrochlorin chelatase [Frankiales bacterium]